MPEVILSTKLFNWDEQKNLFVSFTAELPERWYDFYTESKHGFILESEKTGDQAVFIISNVCRDAKLKGSQLDQHIKYWNLTSKKHKFKVRVYNSEYGKMSKDDWNLLFNKAAEKFIPSELQEAVEPEDVLGEFDFF